MKKELNNVSEKLNIKKKHWKLKLIVFSILLIVIFESVTILIRPSLITLCKVKSESLANSVASKVVREVMSENGYLDLITLDRDNNGNILALRANVIEMNRISSMITNQIQKEYTALEDMYVKIPIGNFTGNEFLSGRGPDIVVKIVPFGTVNSDYKTEFKSTGINQTRHRVYLEIVSKMTIISPFMNHTADVVNTVNIAETVLIGNVPETFYNLEGITDFTTDDTMDMIE